MKRTFGWMALVGLLSPIALSGQTTWDAPSFLRPGAPRGLSAVVTENYPGSYLGALAIWRNGSAPLGVGIRGGIVDAPGDRLIGLFGLDVSGEIGGFSGAGNPRALWWTGAGVGLGDHVSASFPLGLVFGWTGEGEDFSFMPYVGGHVVLTAISGTGDNLELDGVVDLGVDMRFTPSWILRFAGSLGDRETFGFGLVIPR